MAEIKSPYTKSVDIVITGGGLVGGTLALALSQLLPDAAISIVEAVSLSAEYQPSFDSRSVALALGSKNLLQKYGIWSLLESNACPIEFIQVSDRGHLGKTYLDAKAFNYHCFGYVAEVKQIGAVLNKLLAQQSNVTWYRPNKVTAIEFKQEAVELCLAQGELLQAKLLLVADGGQSSTRKMVNIGTKVDDYQQVAVISNVAVVDGHHNKAYERFTDSGPIALLPMTDNRYSLVWCLRPEQAKRVLLLDDDAFIVELQQAFGYRAGVFNKVSSRASYPLKLSLSDHLINHRTALVGNSSHTIHPIAGQGFNLGIRDIDALCQVLSSRQYQLGEFCQLHDYQQKRQADMQQVVSMTDALVRLFSHDSRMMALGRTIGLTTMQLFDGLKIPLVDQAMGFRG